MALKFLSTLPSYAVALAGLSLIVLMNTVILVCGIIITATLDPSSAAFWVVGPLAPFRHLPQPASGRAALFFFWCSIPLVLTTASIVELVKLRRRTLKPRYVVISTGISLLLGVLCVGIWGGCTFSSTSSSYCPFAIDSLNVFSPGSAGTTLIWVTPFILIALLVLYFFYLVISIIAYRHQSQTKHKEKLFVDYELHESSPYQPGAVDVQPPLPPPPPPPPPPVVHQASPAVPPERSPRPSYSSWSSDEKAVGSKNFHEVANEGPSHGKTRIDI